MTLRGEDNELVRVLSQLCADAATDSEREQLAEAIEIDPRVRLVYLEMLADHAELHLLAHASSAAASETIARSLVDFEKIFEPSPAAPPRVPPRRRSAKTPAPSTPRRRLPGFVRSAARWVNRAPVYSAISAGAFLFAFLTLLAAWRIAPSPAPQSEWAKSAPAFVARVTGEYHAEWAPMPVAVMYGSHLRAGQELVLDAGVVEITFDTGAAILLEGPAHLALRRGNAVTLGSGKFSARVESAATAGFVVATPDLEIVDLGTEFGVVVEPEATEVQVFSGSVMVNSASVNSAPGSVILTTGQTAVLHRSEGKLQTGAAPTHTLVRSLPRDEALRVFSTGAERRGADADAHWEVVAAVGDPAFEPGPARLLQQLYHKYLPNEPGRSSWITIDRRGSYPAQATYTFRQTFDLTGFDPATCRIHGWLLADNFVLAVRINGQRIAGWSERAPAADDFRTPHPFRIEQGFVPGENVVEFDLLNSGDAPSAAALRVQWQGFGKAEGGRRKAETKP